MYLSALARLRATFNFFFQIKHILIRDTWRDDVSGDQIMSQRIRGHRLTHHNLHFQANTPPQPHRQQAHPGQSVPDTLAISSWARP